MKTCPGWWFDGRGNIRPCAGGDCQHFTAEQAFEHAQAWAEGLPRHPNHPAGGPEAEGKPDSVECAGCAGFCACECSGSAFYSPYAIVNSDDCHTFSDDESAQAAARLLYERKFRRCRPAPEYGVTADYDVDDMFDSTDPNDPLKNPNYRYCVEHATFRHHDPEVAEFILHIGTGTGSEGYAEATIEEMVAAGCTAEFIELYREAARVGACRVIFHN